MIDKEAFLEAAALAARQVGILARRLQGQVKNEGKAVDVSDARGNDYLIRQKEAVTVVDQIAQDIIITALAPHLPLDLTVLDGEEETPGKALMPATSGAYVLVLDPIDGTLIYLEGGNSYAVNIGLFKDGAVEVALLYFPGLDVAYYTTGKGVFRAAGFAAHGLGQKQEIFLAPQPDNPRSVFVYHAVDEQVVAALKAGGFSIITSPNREFRDLYGDPVEALMKGGVTAGVIETMQVRDLIHGAILSCASGAQVTDWKGNAFNWPQYGGSLPKMLVSGWPLPTDLMGILALHT